MKSNSYSYHVPKTLKGVLVTDKMKYRLGATPFDEYRKHYFGFTGKYSGKKRNSMADSPAYWVLDHDCNTFEFPNGIRAEVTSKSGRDKLFAVKFIKDDVEKCISQMSESDVCELMNEEKVIDCLEKISKMEP